MAIDTTTVSSRTVDLHKRDYAEHNHFDLLRLVLAVVVCNAHACILSGNVLLVSYSERFHADFAVRIFFAVSGFLISLSYERSKTAATYFLKRLCRIYPAYFTTVLASALGFSYISDLPLGSYFGTDWCKYVFANLSFLNFLEPSLPGVFSVNPIQAVNGSLWTLKVECLFYLAVPFLLRSKQLRRSILLTASLYFLSVFVSWNLRRYSSAESSWIAMQLDRQIFDLFTYFISGVFIYKTLSLFEPRRGLALLACAGALILSFMMNTKVTVPFLLSASTLLLCTSPFLPSFKLKVDLSYGIYILHFPVIQVLVKCGVAEHSLTAFFLLTWTLTGVLAYLMWSFVELPFIRMRAKFN